MKPLTIASNQAKISSKYSSYRAKHLKTKSLNESANDLKKSTTTPKFPKKIVFSILKNIPAKKQQKKKVPVLTIKSKPLFKKETTIPFAKSQSTALIKDPNNISNIKDSLNNQQPILTEKEENKLKIKSPTIYMHSLQPSLSSNQSNQSLQPGLQTVPSFANFEALKKTNDEIMELQLKNSRLENQILILNETINSKQNIIDIKETELNMIKNKYTSMINEIMSENTILKEKSEISLKQLKDSNEKLLLSMNSLIKILIDICDIFFNKSSPKDQGDCSIDVYDSFICEEERRSCLIEQIQGLLISKMNSLKKNLGCTIEQKDIDKINSWSSIALLKKNTLSTPNIINTNEDIGNNISKINMNSIDTSNDFDLSVSQNFYNLNNIINNTNGNGSSSNNRNSSPKFVSFDGERKGEKKNHKNSLMNKQKYHTYNSPFSKQSERGNDNLFPLITGGSILSEIKNSSRGSLGDFGSNLRKQSEKSNCFNIQNCSVGDICNNDKDEYIASDNTNPKSSKGLNFLNEPKENKEEKKENFILNKIESFKDINIKANMVSENENLNGSWNKINMNNIGGNTINENIQENNQNNVNLQSDIFPITNELSNNILIAENILNADSDEKKDKSNKMNNENESKENSKIFFDKNNNSSLGNILADSILQVDSAGDKNICINNNGQ